MTEDEADEYAAWKTGYTLATERASRISAAEQRALVSALEPIAKKLGLKINVEYDLLDFGWCIDAGLRQTGVTRAQCTIDEEALFDTKHKAELLTRVMYDLQASVFDATAKRLSELDDRGRTYTLSREDRYTLHEMLDEATKARYVPYGNTALGDVILDKRRRFQALVGKLFK